MAPDEFSFFLALPMELRREIYLLATPPRIVHVKEHKLTTYKEFAANWRTASLSAKLDPSLVHFAFIWRQHIPQQREQPTLESFGFSNSRPVTQPWEPSPDAPAISMSWLGKHPNMAWQLIRPNTLYSTAPIPALLHTCIESRAELIRFGYTLAFSTRSGGPALTWFNFQRDVLLIGYDESVEEDDESVYSDDGWSREYYEADLSADWFCGSKWDVSQFQPKDLRRVRNLALGDAASPLQWVLTEAQVEILSNMPLSNVVRLFGHLEELLLGDWSWQTYSAGGRETGPECCVAVDEADTLLRLFAPRYYSFEELDSVRPDGIQHHKYLHGANANCVTDAETALKETLIQHRNQIMSLETQAIKPWNVPRVRAVHILGTEQADSLGLHRQAVFKAWQTAKRAWEQTSWLGPLHTREEALMELLPRLMPGLFRDCYCPGPGPGGCRCYSFPDLKKKMWWVTTAPPPNERWRKFDGYVERLW